MNEAAAAVRFAVAGFGRLAQRYYVPAFRALGVVPVAVTDPLAACRAAARAAAPGARTYHDLADMLAREPLDALLVASPPSAHAEAWQHAKRARVPVFIEKPFVRPGDLARLEEDAPSPGARPPLMVNFNRRFWPEYRRLAALARAGCIGSVEHAEIALDVDVRPWCSVTRHRLSPAEGGALCDLGSQALDLASMLFGAEPTRVSADVGSRRWEGDHASLRLEFAGGRVAHCGLGYGESNRERVVLRGSTGLLRLDDPNATVHLERSRALLPRTGGRMRDAAVFALRALMRDRSMLRYTVRAAIASFLEAVATGAPPSPGFDAAVRNVRWLAAAARAAEERQPVALEGGAGA